MCSAMKTLAGRYPLEPSTPSLLRQEPLLNDSPAPPGTMFGLGEDGGYGARPASANRLVLGRNSADVHVTVGSSAHPEAIKGNLLRVLPDPAPLVPPDLRLLGTGIGGAKS